MSLPLPSAAKRQSQISNGGYEGCGSHVLGFDAQEFGQILSEDRLFSGHRVAHALLDDGVELTHGITAHGVRHSVHGLVVALVSAQFGDGGQATTTGRPAAST